MTSGFYNSLYFIWIFICVAVLDHYCEGRLYVLFFRYWVLYWFTCETVYEIIVDEIVEEGVWTYARVNVCSMKLLQREYEHMPEWMSGQWNCCRRSMNLCQSEWRVNEIVEEGVRTYARVIGLSVNCWRGNMSICINEIIEAGVWTYARVNGLSISSAWPFEVMITYFVWCEINWFWFSINCWRGSMDIC